jgi:transposase-like protein
MKCCKCDKESGYNLYCPGCKVKNDERKKELIADQLEDGEFVCEDEIYCPYCGYEHEADGSDNEEGEHDYECSHCEKDFVLETSVCISYSTRRRER